MYVVCVYLMCATHVHLCADVVILGQLDEEQGWRRRTGSVVIPLTLLANRCFKMEFPWEEVQASSWALVLPVPDQCLVLRGSWGPQDRGVEGSPSRGLRC